MSLLKKNIQRGITLIILLVFMLSAACGTQGQAADSVAALTATFSAAGTAVMQTQMAALADLTPAAPTQPLTTDTPMPELATSTPEPTATITHLNQPGEPAYRESWMFDSDSSANANNREATRGEFYQVNWLERPFNANTMDTYYPDLDIIEASLSRRDEWVYVTIKLAGQRLGGGLLGTYGVELDVDIDGRGDWLVLAGQPGAVWSTDRVRVWRDINKDVGNNAPIQSDPPQTGDGYETLVFREGQGEDPDLAWARLDPADNRSVQIAFKNEMIKGDVEFLWGAWADQGLVNPGWFDYVDHFTHDEAGSSIRGLSQYPLKALFEVDNTCRWAVGFTPEGKEPGLCPLPVSATPAGQVAATISAGGITGIVFKDEDGNLVYDSGEEGLSNVEVRLRLGNCGSPGSEVDTIITSTSGSYSFSGLAAGTYCVDVPSDPVDWTSKTDPVTVPLIVGSTYRVNFGFHD